MNRNSIIVGKNIQEARKKKKFTQKQVAEKVPMNTNYLAVYERGLHMPPPDRLSRIAQVLGVDTDNLLRGTK